MFIKDEPKIIHHSEAKRKERKELDKIFSSRRLGSFVEEDKTFFRLFAPDAKKVTLIVFKNIDDQSGKEFAMHCDDDGVWETFIDGENYGIFYGYKVYNPNYPATAEVICIDPYSKAVASFNSYFTPRRSIVVKENNYNWEDDNWIQKDWRDLIIYEMHIKDLTAHPTSGCKNPGTYKGLVESGINYIKKLGVNAVEILPVQEFAHIEIPFMKSYNGKVNTWNPYERNYWGYMTAAYFAPDECYSEQGGNIKWNEWSGSQAKQVKDFKDVIKAFHKEGIAVIMDVVYNHLSEYEHGNLKEIDKEYYFRLDHNGNYISQSYCGNDLKTERPMVRRLIVESILYWMKEYHVDGFRFDLGRLIDWETVEEITYEARKINPDVILVCEPWGGGYDPAGFSLRGWGAWNDQIRNGVKGENPKNGTGWIFGKWYGSNNPERIKSYVRGTLFTDAHGLFQKKEHSVNYLSSHDGYTLGDFIRIATHHANPHSVIHDVDSFVKLTPLQLKLNKLAAMFLLTSQGMVMIQEGDEFARTKVIAADNGTPDENKGRLDHNSYNKDNSTNYLNFNHAEINKELFDYYKGLISIRNNFEAFRKADYEDITFYPEAAGSSLKRKSSTKIHDQENHFALGYHLKYKDESFTVLLNANPDRSHEFHLPKGKWILLANEDKAGIKPLSEAVSKIILQPACGCILKKK